MTEAEADVATKAPESDAQEDVTEASAAAPPPPAAAPGPETTEAQPKMGENCHTDRPTRSSFLFPEPWIMS